MSDIRYGLVGCGAICRTHTDAIRSLPGVRLTAVYDIVAEKAQKLADETGAEATRSYASLLKKVDALNICVPSGLHAKLALAAVKAGKHVLVEKPIDVSLRPAQRLVEQARAAGVTLGVVSQHRFANDIVTLRDSAQSGGLGKLVAGDCYVKWYRTQEYYNSGDWRGTVKLDGGCLMNQSVHYIDMIQWIMGGVKSVQAQMRTAGRDIEAEDIAQALVEYKNGATGIIYGTTLAYPGFAERLEVHGMYGTVLIEGDRIKLWQVDEKGAAEGKYGRGVVKQPTPSVPILDGGDSGGTGAADPTAIWGEQHRLQIEDFVQAIRDRRDPKISGESALEPLKVILAIYKSARSGGRRIDVDSLK
ncbi:MAG: Gfo/Idh/MocA family oxidoreductase [Fimbriimonadaceae bacterium]